MKRLLIASLFAFAVASSGIGQETNKLGSASSVAKDNTLVANATHTSRWIKRQADLPENKRIIMRACQNGHDGFQIAVTADGKSIANVNASLIGDLKDSAGNIISASNLQLYRELFLFVTTPTNMDPKKYPEQEIPDPLLPFQDPYSVDHPACGAPFDVGRIGSVGKSYLCVGDGGCFTEGMYTGNTDKYYVVEIDGEGELGDATFRWSDEWDGKFGSIPYQNYDIEPPISSWKGEQVKTASAGICLNDGIKIRFTGGKQVFGDGRRTYKNEAKFNFHKGDRYYFHVYNKCNEVIYGDIYVPQSAKAGEYAGVLRVTADGFQPVEFPVSLTVYGIAIPKEKSMDSAFGGRPNPSSYHSGTEEQMKAIQKNYEEMLHQHRLDYEVFGVVPEFQFASNGDLTSTDWSKFDEVAGPRLDGTYWDDKTGMRRFCMDLNILFPGNPHDKTHPLKKKAISREIARHLKEKGWFEKVYVYCLDEPAEAYYQNIVDEIKMMREADKDWDGKFMCTIYAVHNSPLLPYLNIWTIPTYRYDRWSDYGKGSNYLTREDYRKMKENKNTFWFYVANYPTSGPYMSYQLDRLNCHEPRLLKWASFFEGATGFLFWCTMASNAITPNIYLNPAYTENYRRDGKGCFINGDAFLMYPGDANGSLDWKRATGHAVPFKPINGPLPSIRLKQIRDGFEDWEMFILAEKAGKKDACMKEIGKIYKKLGCRDDEYQKDIKENLSWNKDDEAMWQIRDEIARMIEKK